MKNKPLAQVLRKLADLIENMNEDEVLQFLDTLPKNRNQRPTGKNVGSSKTPGKHRQLDDSTLKDIVREMSNVSTRDAGKAILERHRLTRTELVAIGKQLNAHITKSDNIDAIREKIIEATIGSKLSSAAIRGN